MAGAPLPGQGRVADALAQEPAVQVSPVRLIEGKLPVREVHAGEWELRLWDRVGQEAGRDAPGVELNGEAVGADHGIGLGDRLGFRERWRGVDREAAEIAVVVYGSRGDGGADLADPVLVGHVIGLQLLQLGGLFGGPGGAFA